MDHWAALREVLPNTPWRWNQLQPDYVRRRGLQDTALADRIRADRCRDSERGFDSQVHLRLAWKRRSAAPLNHRSESQQGWARKSNAHPGVKDRPDTRWLRPGKN